MRRGGRRAVRVRGVAEGKPAAQRERHAVKRDDAAPEKKAVKVVRWGDVERETEGKIPEREAADVLALATHLRAQVGQAIRRNTKRDSLRVAQLRGDDSDHAPVAAKERPTGVSRVERGIGLEERLVLRAHYSCGDA